jgi:PAS domain S-box-containing protein
LPDNPILHLVRIGSKNAVTQSEKRNIQLCNFISLVMAGALCLIVVFRFLNSTLDSWFYLPLFIEALLFLALIGVNYKGFTTTSRMLMCWLPPIFLIVDFYIVIIHAPIPETSHYLGFRIFQVAFSIFPFLLFNISETKTFFAALLVPITIVIAYDKILDITGIGYYQSGLTETSYLYNNFRTITALIIIGSAFIFLKKTLENQELKNEKLISQLEERNILIQKNSERALKKAYEKLSYHINNTPLGVIERDKNFKITYWNKRAEELFGWSVNEVVGLKPQNFLIYSEDAPTSVHQMNLALQQKRESNFMECRAITKDGRILNCLWYYSFLRDEQGELDTVLSFISDVTDQRQANYQLKERVKELKTLYNVSQLLTTSGKSMEEVFSKLPDLLPSGWQFPELSATKLTVFGKKYQTSNYTHSKYSQSMDIVIDHRQVGDLSIAYLEEKPDEYEGPFLKEERELLVAIVQMLQVYIKRILEEEELVKAQANLTSAINNTEILIWAVDADFKIITFNEASRKFAREHYKIDVMRGQSTDIFPEPVKEKWNGRYKRVMTGEVLSFEEQIFGMDFKHSISPIIENNRVIGAVVFVDNVTDEKQHLRALTEANNKISQLKMMALRAVMNPHFIFNVLSSIQYFITKNDELNAINYLTSFSKLMRTVLTRSVADFVSLREELDLLADYVHLEKLRFDDKFEFSIQCDPSINADEIMMPSLLIQPYVENAILHGLYNKEGKGSIVVSISFTDDLLLFKITDDGVGRAAAQKVKAKSGPGQKSMGTQLTEERLTILNSDGEPPVVYEDLYNDEQPTGTTVTIRVKINPD